MPLPPFLKRAAPGGEAAGVAKPEPAALVQARRRLIGAAVLLAVGVIVFPLLFESKPRPLPTDLPMTYAPTALRGVDAGPNSAGTGSSAVTTPTSSASSSAGGRPAASASPVTPPPEPVAVPVSASAGAGAAAAGPSADDTVLDEAAPPSATPSSPLADAGGSPSAPSPSVSPPAPSKAPVASTAEPAKSASPTPKASPAPGVKAALPASPKTASTGPATGSESSSAKSGGGPAAASSGTSSSSKEPAVTRYIVQVGAFADPMAARQVRLKVERLGFVTYTHVIDVPGGQRIRVRVGPMTDRTQAQRALDKIRQAGLPGALLTL